jgi:hypothetical protein
MMSRMFGAYRDRVDDGVAERLALFVPCPRGQFTARLHEA